MFIVSDAKKFALLFNLHQTLDKIRIRKERK